MFFLYKFKSQNLKKSFILIKKINYLFYDALNFLNFISLSPTFK